MTASPESVDDIPSAGPLARLWLFLKSRLRPRSIATPDALRTFLEERAALIAQKCAIDYVRGKTGLASHALFTEETFLKALDICRWESFVIVLGDLFIVAEGYLRPHAAGGDRARLCEALIGLYSAAFTSAPLPAHRAHGWDDVHGKFVLRIRAASLAEPRQALDVADHSARRLFETLPIHANYRELDEEVIYGAVRFRMIAVSQQMQRRFAAAELVRQLLADQKVTL